MRFTVMRFIHWCGLHVVNVYVNELNTFNFLDMVQDFFFDNLKES